MPWPEAEQAFRQHPRWRGGDAMISAQVGGEAWWLFGDSFIAKPGQGRAGSRMVRSSVGWSSLSLTDEPLEFAWGGRAAEEPARDWFDHDQGQDRWCWPAALIHFEDHDKAALAFVTLLRKAEGGLGFALDGWGVAYGRLAGGGVRSLPRPAFDPTVSVSAACFELGWVVALVRSGPKHQGLLARWRPWGLLDRAPPEWWDGRRWHKDATPVVVMDDAGPESSLHYEPRLRCWMHVASRGFGATTIAVRTAPRVTGPWSEPIDVYTPPESRGPKPFVYAAKAHPHLTAPREWELVLVYATNSFDFKDLFTPEGQRELYWPRVVRLDLELLKAKLALDEARGED